MGPGEFHQGDARPPAPAEAIAKPSDKLEPRRAAAHYDNPVQRLLFNPVFHAAYRALRAGRCDTGVVQGLAIQHLRRRAYSE